MLHNEELFQLIFEQSPIGKILYGADGKLVVANRAALEIFGVEDPGSVKSLDLFGEPHLSEERRAALRAGESLRLQTTYDFDRIRALGRYRSVKSGVIHVDAVITPIRSGGSPGFDGFLVQVQDITSRVMHARAHAESLETARRLRDETAGLLAAARIVLGAGDFDTAGRSILEVCRNLLGAGDGFVSLGTTADPRSGKSGREALESGMAVYDNAAPDAGPGADGQGGTNTLAVPLVVAGKVEGLLCLAGKGSGFTDRDAEIATAFGELTAIALVDGRNRRSLEEGGRKLEILFELLPVGVSVLGPDAAIQIANPALRQVLGLTTENVLHGGYRRRRYLRSDGSEMPSDEFPSVRAFRDGREVRDTEIGVVREDGLTVWTNVSAAPCPFDDWRVVTTVTDITEQKRVERSLKSTLAELDRQRGFFRALFDSNPNGMLVVDKEMHVRAVNSVLGRMFGLRQEEVAGRKVGDLLKCARAQAPSGECGGDPRCDNCQVLAAIRSAQAGGQPFRNRMTLQVEGRSGRPERLVLLVSALLAEYEQEALTVVILEDITELSQLRGRLRKDDSFAGMISRDPVMRELFEAVGDVAKADVPVLIEGESGTGKELVATAIHRLSRRAAAPFVPVSCASLPEALLESELFGHVHGAFTGAVRDKKGRFELAGAGTIFLDEIGELSPTMQVKLLRVLQEGTFERVGGEKTLRTEARVISATNRNLRTEVAAQRFREDLYYRLAVVPISIPPLRDRRGDIPLLAGKFLEEYSKRYARPALSLSPRAMSVLIDYPWPGNVRELQNVLQYAVIKGKGPLIEPENLPPSLQPGDATVTAERAPSRRQKLTREAVQAALRETGENRSKAARVLGVSRATLYRFLGEGG
jgi:PAS domain S-box-containing protein